VTYLTFGEFVDGNARIGDPNQAISEQIMNKFIAAAFGLVATVSAAQAVEVTGSSLDLSYSAFIDDTDVDKLNVAGSVELAFTQTSSVQLDIGHDAFGLSGLDILSIGAHGIFHVNRDTSLGAFFTHDRADVGGTNGSSNLFGIEAGHDAGPVELEGYLGRGESSGADGTMVGLSGRYVMPNTIGVTGSIDYLDIEGLEVRKLAVRLDGGLTENLNVYVEAGTGKVSAFGTSASEPFVGIGGRITFGAVRGTTFERRSLGELLPGL
jgi:hypothetical protein